MHAIFFRQIMHQQAMEVHKPFKCEDCSMKFSEEMTKTTLQKGASAKTGGFQATMVLGKFSIFMTTNLV